MTGVAGAVRAQPHPSPHSKMLCVWSNLWVKGNVFRVITTKHPGHTWLLVGPCTSRVTSLSSASRNERTERTERRSQNARAHTCTTTRREIIKVGLWRSSVIGDRSPVAGASDAVDGAVPVTRSRYQGFRFNVKLVLNQII